MPMLILIALPFWLQALWVLLAGIPLQWYCCEFLQTHVSSILFGGACEG